MTIEEAIAHSREKVIERSLAGFDECSKEHAQLANWLEELKWRRAEMSKASRRFKARQKAWWKKLKLENIALKEQLRWRPVSEKPEKAGMYLVEGKPYTGCESTIITTAYFDGEIFLWYVVVRWLPIPPSPDTVPDGWEEK